MAFELDRAGGAEVLKQIAAEEVKALAEAVAAAAGANAVVKTVTSKTRVVAQVKVPALEQAKDGVLSKAAAEVGLTINAYPKRDPKKAPAKKSPRKRGRPRKTTTKKSS